jgi:hypothetical protein
MEPVNNKSLLHFLYGQMQKLDSGEISKEQAREQANLAKQANNCMKYELQRTATLMLVDQYRRETGTSIPLREIEGKNFDSVKSLEEA